MMKKLLPIVLLLCCFALANTALATDIPGGDVSGTWTAADNPYIVQGDITVLENESLTIEPGVEVRFDGAYKLFIQGDLSAMGVLGDSITFTSNTGEYNWRGIDLNALPESTDTVRFSFVKVSKMNQGKISAINTDKLVFEDSRMFDNTNHFAGCFYTYNSSFQARRNKFHDNHTANQSDGGVFYISDGIPTIENNIFLNNSATYSGGAISIWRQNGPSTPIIRNNYFEGNTAGGGGAIVIHSNCVPLIENNTFYNNSVYGDGGAIWQGYVLAGTIQYRNNIFLENHADDRGGAIRTIECLVDFDGDVFDGNSTNNSSGGALYFEEEVVSTLTNCRFSNNTGSQGGAVYVLDNSTVNFESCLFNNNTATSFGGAFVLSSYVTSQFSNCIFANNSTSNVGGVMRLMQYSNPVFINCTFANNAAEEEASVASLYWDSDPFFYNCIAYGNTSIDNTTLVVQDYIWHTCEPSISNCLWESDQEGILLGTSTYALWENNIDVDPLFVYPSAGTGTAFDGLNAIWEFLADDSPCIDAGMTEGLTIPEFDFNGETRIQGEFIDLGAFEGGSIISPPGIVQDAIGGDFCADEALNITFVAAGSEPMSFQWYYNSDLLPEQTETDLFIPAGEFEPGSYRCVASNVAGEISSSWAQVAISEPIELNVEVISQINCAGELAELQVSVTGGSAPYEMSFEGVLFFGDLLTDVPPGEPVLEVTDSNGCYVALTVTVLSATPLELNIAEVLPSTCDECADGSISLSTSNGNGEILSINGETYSQGVISGLAMGEYLVVVCNQEGCCVQETITIEEDGFPQEIDFNNDGLITSDDLLVFIGNYGCVGLDCEGDLNGDGLVNVADLILFLGYY